MTLTNIGTYAPIWTDAKGRRTPGPDEDVVTMAIDAALAAGIRPGSTAVGHVVLLTRTPELIQGTAAETFLTAMGLPASLPFEEQNGGAPEVLDRLVSARPGTLVVAVDVEAPAIAGAALVAAGDGVGLDLAGSVRTSLPVRSRAVGATAPVVYDDGRLLREHGWRRAMAALADAEPIAAVAGVPSTDARKLARSVRHVADTLGPAGVIAVLGEMVRDRTTGSIAALENGRGVAAGVHVTGDPYVNLDDRATLPRGSVSAPRSPAEIPASLASYERAFDAKVGLVGAACADEHVTFPPRPRCLTCSEPATRRTTLPRAGTVYTLSTVRAPVPGKDSPYTLAVVSLDGSSVRVLAHVTDGVPGDQRIGDHGALVLRRVAIRAGIPDYGFAFRPDAVTATTDSTVTAGGHA